MDFYFFADDCAYMQYSQAGNIHSIMMTEPETKETSTTPAITINTKTGYVSESPEEDDVAKKVQQRMKLEAHLTSGCGHGKKKTQLLEAFWSTMWKELERIGWRKVRNF